MSDLREEDKPQNATEFILPEVSNIDPCHRTPILSRQDTLSKSIKHGMTEEQIANIARGFSGASGDLEKAANDNLIEAKTAAIPARNGKWRHVEIIQPGYLSRMRTLMIKNSHILWIAAMALAVPFSAHAQNVEPLRHRAGTHVYVASNENGPNSIFVLKRNASGGLDQDQVVSTGGVGTGVGIASRHDPLGSQNSLLLSEDGGWLFAVNAGSNQISVFAVREGRLTLVDVAPSGGVYPVSLAQRGNKLYALNIGGEEANVVAFDITFSGKLQIVNGSTRGLGVTVPNVGNQPNVLLAPTQLQFTPDGKWLVVVLKNMTSVGSIQLFASDQFGNLAARSVTTSANNPLPFGFTFDRGGHLLVTEGLGGAVSSYAIKDNGTLVPISLSVANYQAGNCWIEVVDDLAYTSNTTANTLSAYTISPKGELQLLRGSQTLVDGGRNFLPLDITLSGNDGRYLDEVNPGDGSVGSFLRAKDGSLTFVGSITLGEPFSGFSGLATD